MDAPHSVAIAILAAGSAQRFGAAKQLQTIHGISLVRRAAQTALATGLRVHVVTGAAAAQVGEELHDLPLHLLHNPAWAQGMGTSLALAARHFSAEPQAGALLLMLADQPLVSTADMAALLAEHRAHPRQIVAADYGERRGPPCLFPTQDLVELAKLDGDQGARELLVSQASRVRTLLMPQAALDVDTPADLARAERLLARD